MRTPSYRHHRPTGQGLIEVENGRRIYLGKYGTPEAEARYREELAKWALRQNQPLAPPPATGPIGATGQTLVKDLILRYWTQHVQDYYKKRDRLTSEAKNIRTALKYLRRLHGGRRAGEYDQVLLNEYRDWLIDGRGSRIKTVNSRVNQVREMFRWAAEKKIVAASVWQELLTLKNLKAGRTRAKAGKRVLPVADETVEQTLPFLPDVAADVVRFIRLTGCRPGEPLALRPRDLVRHPEVEDWYFRPEGHKTEHHGKERRVYVGPKAQAILKPYLDRLGQDRDGYCFAYGKNGEPYTGNGLARAVKRALCDLAESLGKKLPDPPKRKTKDGKPARLWGWTPKREWFEQQGLPYWHLNQLRHSAATELEARFGADTARVVLGHSDVRTTKIYAERDFAKAAEAARQIG